MSNNQKLNKELLESIILEELEKFHEGVFSAVGDIAKAAYKGGKAKFQDIGAERNAKKLSTTTAATLEKLRKELEVLRKDFRDQTKANPSVGKKFNKSHLLALANLADNAIRALRASTLTRGEPAPGIVRNIEKASSNWKRSIKAGNKQQGQGQQQQGQGQQQQDQNTQQNQQPPRRTMENNNGE
jgi:Sec-independent protein translocase protein TatA